jgi:phospholipid/cholesterol/gamma-HCH transport system permease protein
MGKAEADQSTPPDGQAVRVIRPAGGPAILRLDPAASIADPTAFVGEMDAAIADSEPSGRLRLECDCDGVPDSILVGLVLESMRRIKQAGLEADASALPEPIRKLVALGMAVAPHRPPEIKRDYFVLSVGRKTFNVALDWFHFVQFIGELTYSFIRLLLGRARFRKRDFWVTLQECGVNALPIVGLLSLLTGIILAFIGAVQLQKFGATIYVTDLVALAMAREMACIMTGVIMSGRTGAAFAAQIGSMNVNQEVDALETLGLSPVEFLVLPRALALILMMPLLTLYSDVIGWFGGFIVAVPMDINAAEYWIQLKESLTLNHILFGLSKSFIFGIIVAASGCYYGLTSGRNSAAVGEAATKAVVAGITWIVIVDALFAFIDEILT